MIHRHYIRTLIKVNGGIAITDINTGEILSFGLINDLMAIGVLNTVEKARGKGYAEIIVKMLSKALVESFNIRPTTFISSKNFKSINLFTKLGFTKIADINMIAVGNK